MKKILLAAAIVAALTMPTTAVTITVTPWSAPNAFGSPNYAGAVNNQIHATINGLSSYGDPNLPTYYEAVSGPLSLSENIVTGFNSWNGDATPSPAFASELGNRLLFGLYLDGGGTKVSINNLGFFMDSTDVDNSLDYAFGTGSYNYSTDYRGWNYGVDGIPNTGDDSFITSGANTQLVDAIIGRGSGNAWAAYSGDPDPNVRQAVLDATIASIDQSGFTFTGTYTYLDVSGYGSVEFKSESVPDAGSTMALAGVGFAFLAFVRRKMK